MNFIIAAWASIHDVPGYKKPYHVAKTLLAIAYLKCYPNIEIIGIAGSVGKTTTKEAIAQVLKLKYRIKYSRANIDPVFNIPSTILSLRPGDQMLILELGIEHKGDMAYYLSLVKPKLAVMTKLSLEHSQFLGTLWQIVDHEAMLLKRLPSDGLVVLNHDDEESQKVRNDLPAPVISYGFVEGADFLGRNYQETDTGSSFVIKTAWEEQQVVWSLFGKHTSYAGLAAAAVGSRVGIGLTDVTAALATLQPPENRMNIFQYNGATIINDTYNAMPAAMLAALDTLGQRTGRKIAILATMKELGDLAEMMHREVGKKIATIDLDHLALWGEYTDLIADQAIKDGFPADRIMQAKSFDELASWVKADIKPKDTVLIKGSRHHIHLERLAYLLQGKSPKVQCPICPEC